MIKKRKRCTITISDICSFLFPTEEKLEKTDAFNAILSQIKHPYLPYYRSFKF